MGACGDNLQDGTTFFRNVACAHFPCHDGVDPREFNCLFCYCPLYALGPNCGGDFAYTERGIKDCSACVRLHVADKGAAIVRAQFGRLAALARREGAAEAGAARPRAASAGEGGEAP